jgi:hypothetical protein
MAEKRQHVSSWSHMTAPHNCSDDNNSALCALWLQDHVQCLLIEATRRTQTTLRLQQSIPNLKYSSQLKLNQMPSASDSASYSLVWVLPLLGASQR